MRRRSFLKGLGFTGAAMVSRGVFCAQSNTKTVVYVAPEGFEDFGGWTFDTQHFDKDGVTYPFLLAHGIGEPVKDAVATVEFPETGEYQLFVRTRDWVGPWKQPDTPENIRAEGYPGIFQVLIDDKPCPTTFGNEKTQWHWQKGGSVTISKPKTRIALRDLTGFAGRCEALIFSKDPAFVPPEDLEAMHALRCELQNISPKPEDTGQFDLLVAGGGFAGMGAAISAARQGLKVAFIQDRPVLGGNGSSEVRVMPLGSFGTREFPAVGRIKNDLVIKPEKAVSYRHEHIYIPDNNHYHGMIEREKNIALFLSHKLISIEKNGNTISAGIIQDLLNGRRKRMKAKLLVTSQIGDLNTRLDK